VESPSKLFGAVLGLTAFALAIVAGLASGADSASIVERAIVSMLVCYAFGAVLGVVAGHAVQAYLRENERDNPPVDLAAAVAAYDHSDEAIE
jgi:NhaP-type Na+/H+ or K+/H+ antiporter